MSDKAWMVRAGEGGYLFDDFIEKSIVAIGWNSIGDFGPAPTLDELKSRLRETDPHGKERSIAVSANQIIKFVNEFSLGDYVVCYNPGTRLYQIGKIASDYIYDKDFTYNHTRKVEWTASKSRDLLEPSSRDKLSSFMTLFNVPPEVLSDLLKAEASQTLEDEAEENDAEELEEIKDDVIERAHEFIKDKLAALSWDKMQDFVAGLLRAMGYITQVSPKGPDRGKDIIASPDGLGLEEPRIKVEVKHHRGQIGSPDVRSFIGALRSDKGIYVSTGGFTKEAKYEAERSDKPLTLIDLDALVWITTQYYDKFDSEAKSLLPLKKVYWPL